MDQWACDRRDMRVNDPRERIAAAEPHPEKRHASLA
jgi:hypothetical protein